MWGVLALIILVTLGVIPIVVDILEERGGIR